AFDPWFSTSYHKDEEHLLFLTDPGVDLGPDTQTTFPINAAFQSDDLDAFDSDCDEAPSANIEIKSDSNIISYDQYMKENKSEVVQGTTSPEQQNAMIMYVIDEMSNQVAKCNAVNPKNKTMNESLTAKLERYKEHVKNFDEGQKFTLNELEKYIDSQMREIIVNRNAKFVAFEK
ncbi:hypothetical protein Tco_0928197, partial [Tanacetum coccineum]